MKKTLVRIVALLMLAVMILSVVPAFASGIIGTITNTTDMYQKANSSSKVVASVKGTVNVLYQNNEGTMYQVSMTHNGTTYTGWVPASAVSNIGRASSNGTTSGSVSTGSTGTTTGSTTSTGTFSGTLSAGTSIYGSDNKLVGTVQTKGNVTVNYRNADGSQLYITTGGVSGWVPASSVSGLYKKGSGSAKVSDLPTTGVAGSTATGSYSAYSSAVTGVSKDSTIYIRPSASSSTSGATKIRSAKGLSFTILGESGDYYYASYNGTTGFVRKRDFSLSSGSTTGTTTGTTAGTPSTTYDKAKSATSNDSTIYMRVNPDKSTAKDNVVVKVTSARGASFSLLGESGDWYYAQYSTTTGQTYKGYVRKADFTVNDGTPIQGATATSTSTSGATSQGTGSSSEKWGSFSVPGGSTYPIYGNYYRTVSGNNYYYYATKSNGKETYDYLHTTTAAGSQIHVVMGHNMRKSGSMFHKLHHVQNAILGVSKCEASDCGASCSGYKTTTISASLDGYKTWDIALFYEIPKGSSTSILNHNSQPWKTSTQSYLQYQQSYAKTSGYKGWVNPNVSLDANGKYMMLITCGDKYESSSNATSKLYMLLKARG
ncbi:MAG: hypothetical protein IKU32_05635 [Clostridia bacterium]|nr:hypothetical protein [Clostridia bacterium]